MEFVKASGQLWKVIVLPRDVIKAFSKHHYSFGKYKILMKWHKIGVDMNKTYSCSLLPVLQVGEKLLAFYSKIFVMSLNKER